MDFLATTTATAVTYGDWSFTTGIAVYVLVLCICGFFFSIFKDL